MKRLALLIPFFFAACSDDELPELTAEGKQVASPHPPEKAAAPIEIEAPEEEKKAAPDEAPEEGVGADSPEGGSPQEAEGVSGATMD